MQNAKLIILNSQFSILNSQFSILNSFSAPYTANGVNAPSKGGTPVPGNPQKTLRLDHLQKTENGKRKTENGKLKTEN